MTEGRGGGLAAAPFGMKMVELKLIKFNQKMTESRLFRREGGV